jgi:hypothetical protein
MIEKGESVCPLLRGAYVSLPLHFRRSLSAANCSCGWAARFPSLAPEVNHDG